MILLLQFWSSHGIDQRAMPGMSRFTGALENITQIMHDFDANHDHEWQAGFNGRSGGMNNGRRNGICHNPYM